MESGINSGNLKEGRYFYRNRLLLPRGVFRGDKVGMGGTYFI
jgi:hypothetical protein